MCPHISLTLGSPSSSAFLAHKRLFRHESSSLISKRQPGSLTITSASLCYHLPRASQLDTRKLRYAAAHFHVPLETFTCMQWVEKKNELELIEPMRYMTVAGCTRNIICPVPISTCQFTASSIQQISGRHRIHALVQMLAGGLPSFCAMEPNPGTKKEYP